MSDEYDVIAIGAGLAGLTAAMFAGRYGLRTALIDTMGPGGQVMNIEHINNFPGFPKGVAGYELAPLVWEQAAAAGAEFKIDEVMAIEPDSPLHRVVIGSGQVSARAVIIACGSRLRSLGIPGEEEFLGLGVSHCASCDGPLFMDKTVGVVGGGDSALLEALALTEYAGRVLIFHRGDSLRAEHALVQQVRNSEKIELRLLTEVEAIIGGEMVTGVKTKDVRTGQSGEVELSGVFIYVGLEPNSAFLKGVLRLDRAGHIVTDINMATDIAGIYAAGDIRQDSARQLITAAGDGATAATAAYRYIKASQRRAE